MIARLADAYFVRPLASEDIDGPYPGWFEDPEVCRFNSHGKFFRTKEHFREYVASIDGDDRVVWAICHDGDGHIGNITLQEIAVVDRTAEFAILLGNKKHWGKGVGTMAGRALLAHGFLRLNLERIYCGTAATNDGMRKLAAALGMTHEGTRRSHVFLDGERVDVLDFGILRSEFLAGAGR
jgi:ribosomal-protein-alanine N-acetyltransferase